jgi:CelD/BcsL family acetyltransferase involved in cellulose biosynthesis
VTSPIPEPVRLRFQVGARTLTGVSRRLIRVPLSLDMALVGEAPALPPLGSADGWLVTSLPDSQREAVAPAGMLVAERQRYPRHWIDLSVGHEAWRAGLSANMRSSLARKTRKLAAAGRVEVRAYRTADELIAFHALARPLAAITYQARLLGAALPETPDLPAAAADEVRAWLLLVDDVPVAYLHTTADGATLRYDHVGHDPAWSALSSGTVLHAHAMADLFAERRFARFDFTEGDGQHKRQFATGSVACCDLLILRPTPANRVLLAALATWDAAMAAGKRATRHPALKRLADRLRRA